MARTPRNTLILVGVLLFVATVTFLHRGSDSDPKRDDRPASHPTEIERAVIESSAPVPDQRLPVAREGGSSPPQPWTDAFHDQWNRLHRLKADAALYRELRALFESDPELAARLALAMLDEQLRLQRPGSQACETILAAWLDSGAQPTAVLDATFGVLQAIEGAETSPHFAALTLGLAFGFDMDGHRAAGIPAPSPTMLRELLSALAVRSVDEPVQTGVAVVVAIQHAPVGDALATRVLTAFARQSPHAGVRDSAITALGSIAGPAEILYVASDGPRFPTSEEELHEAISIVSALSNCSNHDPSAVAALRGWIRTQLQSEATTDCIERLHLSLLQDLAKDDVAALHELIARIAVNSPSENIRSAASRVLARAH